MANICSGSGASSGKRMKKRKSAQLHDLPDDILVDVLSHLGFADATRTSVLSSRWRRLWRSCHRRNLVFTRETMFWPRSQAQGEEDFARNVDSVLRQLSPTVPREKFVLEFRFIESSVQCHVDRWAAFCAVSRVKDIVFDFNPESWGSVWCRFLPNLSLHHFSNGSPDVRSLHLMSVSLCTPPSPPDFCGFTNLRELKLDSVSGDLQCLLLPALSVLEWLSITRCTLHSLSTSQPMVRLRYMCVQYCNFCEMYEIEVEAPNLVAFQFGSFEVYPHPVVFVLDGCVDIQEVTVTVLTEEDLFDYAFAKLPASCMAYARKLSMQIAIDTQMDCQYIEGVANIWLKKWPLPHQPHDHLKMVHMSGVYGNIDMLNLALHFARSAMVLERMVIDPMVKKNYAMTHSAKEEGRRMAREHLQGKGFDDILTIL